jgi:hypothetical protein
MMNYRKLMTIASGLLVLAFAVSACASASSTQEGLPNTGATQQAGVPVTGTTPQAGLPSTGDVDGVDSLVSALTSAGATVEAAGEVQQDFFDVKGQLLKVNGMEVQAFEFADEATRQAISDQISPDGSAIATSMVEWIDQPNFWAKGRLIVLYLGTDAATIDLITSVMGAPVTVHEQ